jgi:hypothetical protein
MAGLGAYGGAGLGEGLIGASSAGASTAAAEAAKAASEQLVRDNAMAASVGADLVTGSAADKFVQDAASKAYSNFAAQPLMAQAKGSFGALKDAGGLSSLLRPAFAAATPIMADAMTPTTTQMPTGQRYQGTIRPYRFDPYTRTFTAQPTYPAVPVNTAPEPAPQEQQPPGGYNTGGIVALANGGTPPGMTGSVAEQNVLNTKGWQSRSGLTGIEGLNSNINMWFNEFPQARESDIRNAMQQYGLNDADIMRATGKSVAELGYKPPAPTPAPEPAPAPVITPGPSTPGTQGPSVEFGGDTVTPEYVAPQPEVTQTPAFQPTAPTMSEVVNAYEQGGGATRMPTITDIKPGERTYTLNAVADMITGFLKQNPNAKYSQVQQFAQSNGIPEMQARAAFNEFRFNTMTGGTKNAYDYLMGRAPYPTKPFVPGGGPIMRPYAEAMGLTGSAENRFRSTMPPRGGEAGTTGTTTTTTKTPTSVERLRTSFDQSIFGKTPTEKAAYYNSLLAQGYDDASIRAAINAPLDENWLALRAIAEQLRAGTTGGKSTTSSAVTGGGTTTTGGGVTTLLGGKGNTTTGNTVDTTRSTDAATVGGVVVGNNVIDPISGRVIGVVTANVDQGTGGIIQGDVVVDPITGKIIGYSEDAGLVARLVNKKIGEEPAPIESRYVPSDTAYYDFGQGDIGGYGGSYTQDEMDMLAGMRRGGLAGVAAAAARGGNVQQYNLGGYSDGGRLLRGPGDGVSDSIPATIGNKQPARLADGEFVIPARIVSEIGNGSTEAGARKLYAMMDRVQRARAKTTGKGKVAKNTRAEKYLPA